MSKESFHKSSKKRKLLWELGKSEQSLKGAVFHARVKACKVQQAAREL